MQRISIQNIKAVNYYPVRMMLEVQFMGENAIYQYYDVPEDVWYAMRNVSNIDIFFNTQILHRYRVLCKDKGKNGSNGKMI